MSIPNTDNPLTYLDAGVDIDAGNRLVDKIKPHTKSTNRPGVLSGLGGFGGLFELPAGYKQPVLVSGTDGVGTKLNLATMMNRHDTIGIDLVAMCVNDIIVTGAEPLYFLDYYATGSLDVEKATDVIKGIAEGCKQSGAALIGGETAEMPGMYAKEDYDLAGFAVGVVEKADILSPDNINTGNILLGLESSGPHSNGFSLIRKVLELSSAPLDTDLDGSTLGDALLAPTKIYVKPLLELIKQCEVPGIAHITGGGLTENLPRILPEHSCANIQLDSWPQPAIFKWLQDNGNITNAEMLKTFNCGIGMVVVLNDSDVATAQKVLNDHQINSFIIGSIANSEATAPTVNYL